MQIIIAGRFGFAVVGTALRQKERPKTLPSYPESSVPPGRAFGNVISLDRQATPADRVLPPAAHRHQSAAPIVTGKCIVSARRPPSRAVTGRRLAQRSVTGSPPRFARKISAVAVALPPERKPRCVPIRRQHHRPAVHVPV